MSENLAQISTKLKFYAWKVLLIKSISELQVNIIKVIVASIYC